MTDTSTDSRYRELLVQANAAKQEPLAAEASLELEGRIADAILKDVPTAMRSKMLQALTSGAFEAQLDARAQKTDKGMRTWDLVQALQGLQEHRKSSAHRVYDPHITNVGKIGVQVVIVPQLKDPSADAMIYRRPNDNGNPIVVLREDALTPEDIQRAVAIAAQNVSTSGHSVSKEQWISVHRHSDMKNQPVGEAASAPTSFRGLLDGINSNQKVVIPGVGEGRTAWVWTRPPRPREARRASAP